MEDGVCRKSQCHHWLKKSALCSLDGHPCVDGSDGIVCPVFLDESTRPSPAHVFDIHTGTWMLPEERECRHGSFKGVMTEEERKVVGKIAAMLNIGDRFVVADRWLDDTQTRRVEHPYLFDRIFDPVAKTSAFARGKIAELDSKVDDEMLMKLSDRERLVYGWVLEKFKIDSQNVGICGHEDNIFKCKGLYRRQARWACMDELVNCLLNPKAIEYWNRNGYPKGNGRLMRAPQGIPTIKDFRGWHDQTTLTEEEFNRISRVFRECINMK